MSFSIISNENVFSKSQGTNRTEAISDLFQSEENQRFAKRKREDLISTKLVEQTSTSTLIGEKKTIETLFKKRTRKLFFLAQKKNKNKTKQKQKQKTATTTKQKKQKNFLTLFMHRIQLSQSCRDTTRQCTFNHQVRKSSWHSLDRPRKDERLI